MSWPSPKVVAAALCGGPVQVLVTPVGAVRVVRSSDPDLFLIVHPEGSRAACGRCKVAEAMPPAPTSRGLNGRGEPLFAPGSRAHAVFVLTWLHDFERRHESCQKK